MAQALGGTVWEKARSRAFRKTSCGVGWWPFIQVRSSSGSTLSAIARCSRLLNVLKARRSVRVLGESLGTFSMAGLDALCAHFEKVCPVSNVAGHFTSATRKEIRLVGIGPGVDSSVIIDSTGTGSRGALLRDSCGAVLSLAGPLLESSFCA